MILVDNVDNSVDKTKLLSHIRAAIENVDIQMEERNEDPKGRFYHSFV